jgi:hypothetical protein
VALVCLVWGEEFSDFFARYCIPSLLETHNIPLLARTQNVTLLLYTDRSTQDFLDRCDSFKALTKLVKVDLLLLDQLPATARTNHWVPWQHALLGRNRDFDRFLVIIPDCVYAAGSLASIVDALERHDTVCYSLPQVCRETVTIELEELRRVDGHEYISFTPLQAVELFIRHVNPKHAAAACSSRFFMNHPEYVIQLSPQSIVVSETASHPFAIRSNARSVSYTFDTPSPESKACYLEILGVSAEPALKFVEQYYRWPKLHREHSRLMNLGRWASTFRDGSGAAYARTANRIALDHGRVLAQHRGQVDRPKTRFTNATLDYLAVATRVFERACEFPDTTAAKYIALAIAAPGFHRHLRKLQSGFTVVLPKARGRFEEVVEKIEARPAATDLLRRFLFLHIASHQLPIVPGHAIFLTCSDATDQFAKAFVVDPLTDTLVAALRGRALSRLQWVWDNVFCVEADVDYSQLTWSMLDPLHGTSECVLGHAASNNDVCDVERLHGEMSGPAFAARHAVKYGAVKLYHAAIKLPLMAESAWLMRNVYRKRKGRPWLSKADAGISRPVSRLPERRPPAEKSARASYDAIYKLNIVDHVAKITMAFYERLGLNPWQMPVGRYLANLRSQLAEQLEAHGAVSADSHLERFEFAWRIYEAGRTQEGLQLFRAVVEDARLFAAGAADPRAREAFVRSAEILGHHAELRGDASAAGQLYRRILEFDGNGIVARRLLLMLWRDARFRESADLAPRLLNGDCNLAQYLKGSDGVADLTHRLRRETRRCGSASV